MDYNMVHYYQQVMYNFQNFYNRNHYQMLPYNLPIHNIVILEHKNILYQYQIYQSLPK